MRSAPTTAAAAPEAGPLQVQGGQLQDGWLHGVPHALQHKASGHRGQAAG